MVITSHTWPKERQPTRLHLSVSLLYSRYSSLQCHCLSSEAQDGAGLAGELDLGLCLLLVTHLPPWSSSPNLSKTLSRNLSNLSNPSPCLWQPSSPRPSPERWGLPLFRVFSNPQELGTAVPCLPSTSSDLQAFPKHSYMTGKPE